MEQLDASPPAEGLPSRKRERAELQDADAQAFVWLEPEHAQPLDGARPGDGEPEPRQHGSFFEALPVTYDKPREPTLPAPVGFITVRFAIPLEALGHVIGRKGVALASLGAMPGIRRAEVQDNVLTLEAMHADALSAALADVVRKVAKSAQKSATSSAASLPAAVAASAPFRTALPIPDVAAGAIIGKKGAGLEQLRAVPGVAHVKLVSNDRNEHELQVSAWNQAALEAVVVLANTRVQAAYARINSTVIKV